MRQQEASAETWFINVRLIISVNMQEHWHLSFVLLISSNILLLPRLIIPSFFSNKRRRKMILQEWEERRSRRLYKRRESAKIRSHLQTLPESLPSSLPLRSKWFFLFRRMMEFHTFLRLIPNIESSSAEGGTNPRAVALNWVNRRSP